MADRWTSEFKILDARQPVKRSPSGSMLRALTKGVRDELGEALTAINRVYDGRLINTSAGQFLDKHGVKLGLARLAGETDAKYRAGLLADLRTIPDGLIDVELYNAVYAVTSPDVPVITQWYKYPWGWPAEKLTGLGYFGLNTIGGNATTIYDNSKVGCKFTLTEDALITKMHVYVGPKGAGSRNVHVGIYDDNAGVPNVRLAVSTDNPQVAATADWYEFSLNLTLTPGDYWLAVNVSGGDVTTYYDTGSTNQSAGNADIPPPSHPFGTVGAWNPYAMPFYAGYTVINPAFTREKWMNTPQTRFTVSVVLQNSYTGGQLDTIEANVTAVKPAHIMVRIVRDQTTHHELLREIL